MPSLFRVKENLKILQNNFEVVGESIIPVMSCDCYYYYVMRLSGDDGEGEEPTESHLVRRSDNSFVFWCSGRVNCDGLLVHLEVCL